MDEEEQRNSDTWKGKKTLGYSSNIVPFPTYDPWVGIRIGLMLGGVLMYYSLRFLFKIKCIPHGHLSHYERYRKQNREKIRRRILLKYRFWEYIIKCDENPGHRYV